MNSDAASASNHSRHAGRSRRDLEHRSSMMTRWLMVLPALAVLAASAPALAESRAGPRETIETANREIQALLEQRAADGTPAAAQRDKALKRVVSSLLDIDTMAEKALGRQWRHRTSDEQRRYLELMRQLVERSYLRQARDHRDYTVTIGDVDERDGEAEVETTLEFETRGRRETIEVVYTLERRDGRWRVVDVETDGASTVRNYRAQFRRIIRESGFEALLARMRERLEAGETDL